MRASEAAVRINKGQRNFDGVTLAQLTTWKGYVDQQIANRLAGNGTATTATEEIEIAGLALRATPADELMDLSSDLANAIQKKLPGAVFTQGAFGGCYGDGGDCYRINP